LTEEFISSIENRKLRTELEVLKQASEKKLLKLNTQSKILKEECDLWKSKFEKLSSEKLELEREIENEEERHFNTDNFPPPRARSVSLKAPRSLTLKPVSIPYLLSPRQNRKPFGSAFLKKGWFDVQENENSISTQFVVLTEEAILGFEHENVDRIPEDAVLITIPLDKVSNVVLKDDGLAVQDKGGNYYHFKGPDSGTWRKLINSLLPC